jgi:hypothetical protein
MPVFGAEPVTVPSGRELSRRAPARPRHVSLWSGTGYGLGGPRPPGAGNVTDQYPDFARARRARATFCESMRIVCICLGFLRCLLFRTLQSFTTKAQSTRRKTGGTDQIGVRRTPPALHGTKRHRDRSRTCPLPPEGGPTAPRAGSFLCVRFLCHPPRSERAAHPFRNSDSREHAHRMHLPSLPSVQSLSSGPGPACPPVAEPRAGLPGGPRPSAFANTLRRTRWARAMWLTSIPILPALGMTG